MEEEVRNVDPSHCMINRSGVMRVPRDNFNVVEPWSIS